MDNYHDAVTHTMWVYADRHHKGELDGGARHGRPPVLALGLDSKNVLVPSKGPKSDQILSAIPPGKRHRWFRSFRSSQALTQSVFGSIAAFNRLNLLEKVDAECGQPAFFNDRGEWAVDFEYDVNCLGERRSTSIDVLFTRPGQRVAIECKFMEAAFGVCSRTDRRQYPEPEQHCDGNYRIQSDRRNRCALTEIGIRYWSHLPHLFDWPSNRDHLPCPFGAVYQPARNVLAATIDAEGRADPTRGHALVVYDSRNPAFCPDGKADKQWRSAAGASLHNGLLRRLSWQNLLTSLAEAPEFTYLIDGLREKYGLEPSKG